MNRTILLLVGALICATPLVSVAQVKNEGLANQIIAARQKNAALVKQYDWNCNTEFLNNGEIKDTRIDAVGFGPDGTLQHSVINDEHASLPQGFLRRAVAQNKREEMESYINGLHKLLNQYTLSSAGAVVNFVSQANIQTGQAPDGTPSLTLTGGNIVTPGDNVTLTVNPTNFQTLNMEISTLYDNNQVTMSASFKSMAGGPTHVRFATVQVPAKTIVLQIHNYDYTLLVPVVAPPPPAQGPAIGSTVSELPAGFASMVVNGQQYYQCGSTWYRPFFAPNGAYMYAVVAAP
jgi:hypothetical protein